MSRALSQREKVLSFAVGGAVFLVVNLFVFDFVSENYTRLQIEQKKKAEQLKGQKRLVSSIPLWEKRDQWLRAKQPVLENEARAREQLQNYVQEIGKKQSVSVEKPVFGEVERLPYYTAITLSFETKSTWKNLVAYLADLQKPDQFLVLENTRLQQDGTDATQMRGTFRVARWYSTEKATPPVRTP